MSHVFVFDDSRPADDSATWRTRVWLSRVDGRKIVTVAYLGGIEIGPNGPKPSHVARALTILQCSTMHTDATGLEAKLRRALERVSGRGSQLTAHAESVPVEALDVSGIYPT